MSVSLDRMAHLRTSVTRMLRDVAGISEPAAAVIATEFLEQIREEYRGERVYFAALFEAPEERHRAILRDFNGRNHAEVCAAHGVSQATLYRVLKKFSHDSLNLRKAGA